MPPQQGPSGKITTEEAKLMKATKSPDASSDENDVEPAAYEYPKWYASRDVHSKSLEDQASCMSDWFLNYLSPLLRLGSTKVLEMEDIGVPSQADRASAAFETMEACWQVEMEKTAVINAKRKKVYDEKVAKMSAAKKQTYVTKNPFVKTDAGVGTALFKAFGRGKVVVAIWFFILSALVQFVPVLILEDLVKYFENINSISPHKTFVHPWVEVAALGLLPLLTSILQTRSQVIFQHMAVFVRTAVSTLLYKKSLNVSASGRACTSTGQVVNMMSNDTAQLQRFIQFGGMILVAPLQIILSLLLIYRQVGPATFVGIGFMIFLAPINIVVFSIVGKMRRKVLKYSDLRVKMMNEILSGIRIIKFYAWEKPFKKEVGMLREKELKALTNLAYVSAVGFSLILLSAPIIQPILVFLVYINIQDEPLSASTAFTTVALFNIMRFPFAFLPMGMLQFIQSRISLRRLGNYLQLPELAKYVVSDVDPNDLESVGKPSKGVGGSVSMTNCSFSWTNHEAELIPIDGIKKKKKERRGSNSSRGSSFGGSSNASSSGSASGDEEAEPLVDVKTIQNVSLKINAGELVAVVGPVGSGKSSLLSAILGEMEPLDGSKIYIPRSDAEMDDINFISYCSQTPWVVNDTLRGNILFGREFDQERYDEVIEACALLDDLAVLPSGDKTEIGEKGINLSGGQKARVSLARGLYAKGTKLILLDDPLSAVDAHVGEHLFQNAITGPVASSATRILVTHHVHFLPRCDKVIMVEGGKIQHFGRYSDLVASGVDFAGAVEFEEKVQKAEENSEVNGKANDDGEVTESKGKTEVTEKKEEFTAQMKKKGENLTTKEEREEGAVATQAYTLYARAGGLFLFLSVFLIQGVGRAAEVGSAFWLAHWAKKAIGAVQEGEPLTDEETTYYLNIYAMFGMIGVFGLTVRSICMALHRLNASKQLHNNLTSSILRAPVSFFDVTPTGRVLNRFAADMDKIDLDLTNSIGQGMGTIFSVMGAIGAICAATKGTFLIPLIPIGYLYYIVQKWFRKTSTELQRVSSVAGSPLFSDFSQVLTGTSTIRAYDSEQRFFDKCQNSFDNYNASYFLVYMCNYWLGLRLDFLGGLISAFIGGVAVATVKTNFIPAGWLGLALSYAIEVTGFLKHGVRMIATIEADMNSVERVLYYTDNVEWEAPDVVPNKDPSPEQWPSQGEIKIENGSMRYRDGPLVLKDISLKIEGGEKIGVVGRTGSGKSSLMNLLFRITEIEDNGGFIEIDGVNVAEIGTGILRTKLSIIPQDPIMFSNTVRYNIDPFGSSTESEIQEVLEKVQLSEVINALPEGLDDEVAEGGENFSQGQRQLLCIARSLLRKPKILVMDEATASIDNETDAAIQQMIRENFKNATVLTIAHRLNTILDSDRVLVLDDGKIAEFDTPENLLKKENGVFKGMVDRSRAATSK